MTKDIRWDRYLDKKDKPFPEATEEQVQALEKRLGVKFPKDYRECLKLHQGCIPFPDGIPFEGGSTVFGCLFHVFMEGGPNMGYSIISGIDFLQEYGYENLIPFSDNGGNRMFCFDYNQDPINPPIILIEGDFEKDDPRGQIPLARNFTEFLNMLEDDEDDD